MSCKSSNDNTWSLKRTGSSAHSSISNVQKSQERREEEKATPKSSDKVFNKTARQSSLRKHFFYQPIRVNRELIDDELPNPDTVRNVRQMFETTLARKCKATDSAGQKVANGLDNAQETSKNGETTGSDESRYSKIRKLRCETY